MRERRSRADDHLVAVRVLVEHVQRLAGRDSEPAPLPDREPVLAVVAADDVAVAVDDSTGRRRRARRGGPGTGPGSVPARKHRSWESALLATGSPAAAAIRLTSGLVSSPSGNRMRASDAGDERGEHVGLVLGGIGGDPQQRAGGVVGLGDPGVVTGGQALAAEPVGEVEHRVEADVAVAADARVRGLAGRERRR